MHWHLSPSLISVTFGTVAAIAAALLAWLAVRRLSVVRVEGESMRPTFLPGEVVLCWDYGRRRPAAGELVIVRREAFPPLLVKRVLAAPGELLPEAVDFTRPALPEERYFLVADNAASALPKRWIGPVEQKDIEARVLCVLWPWRRWRRPR